MAAGADDELELGNFVGVTFRSPLVEAGRELFNSEESGPCALCHRNATALNEGGFNGMFDIGVQRRRNTPAQRLDPDLPADGGFGPCARRSAPVPAAGCGDGRFNTPSLIEAADTAPSFHDNSAATIEDAVRFYTTATFANSTEGQTLNVRLERRDIVAIAALLRTLNAIENIRSSNALPEAGAGPAARGRAAAAAAGGRRHRRRDRRAHRRPAAGSTPTPSTLIRRAQPARARGRAGPGRRTLRDYLLRRAIELKRQARDLMYRAQRRLGRVRCRW